jgi:D-threo-aldose 1-dehydrogenase
VNRRRLGRTAVEVTELGRGTAPIGNLYEPVADDDAAATVATAWDAGVRFFDTAPHYGLGLAEARLGKALAGRPREEFTVSTKVGRLLEPNPAPTGSDLERNLFAVPDDLVRRRDYSADGVRRSLESSLARLGLDRVDVVLVHDPDQHLEQAITEAIPALAALREEGVVGAVGVGMNQWEAELEVVRRSDVDVVMLAGRWTLLDRGGAPLLAECADRGVSVVAAGPFNSGLLARPEPPDDAMFDYRPAPGAAVARARELATELRAHGVELPQAALQFPLRHPAVASVVTGLRTPAEVSEAAARLATPVPDAAWGAVERSGRA